MLRVEVEVSFGVGFQTGTGPPSRQIRQDLWAA